MSSKLVTWVTESLFAYAFLTHHREEFKICVTLFLEEKNIHQSRLINAQAEINQATVKYT